MQQSKKRKAKQNNAKGRTKGKKTTPRMSVSTVIKILHTSARASGNMKGKAREKKSGKEKVSNKDTQKRNREKERRE